ncbi:polysaccharide lyase 6 family protein [Actinopolymorpha pittospori]|nr:polysaccharide lyase 6 family protein [Actinopolymorpha pittospori]
MGSVGWGTSWRRRTWPVAVALLGGVLASLLVITPGPAAAAGSTWVVRGPAAHTVSVDSLAALQGAIDVASPGTRIVVRAGTYDVTEPIRIAGRSGAPGAPIVVAAERVGAVELTGAAGFTVTNSSYVVLRGFRLTHRSTLRIPADSSHIRVTRNHFELPAADGDHWLNVDGNDVEVDHNTFANRANLGVYLSISGPDGDVAKRTWIHHNYFFHHTYGGDNGGEPIRLGLSSKQSYSAYAVVENNLFDQVNGDPEAISVKSSDNIIRSNTVVDSVGSIVLRHGNRNRVEGNFLLGGRSGIRFYGNDHQIVNNVVSGSAGSGIVIGSGSVVDDTASTGNDRPDRVTVAFNTLVGNAVSITGEGNRPLEPHDCVVANNIVSGSGTQLVTMPRGEVGFRWEGNILHGAPAGDIPVTGFTIADPLLSTEGDGVPRLTPASPAVNAAVGSFPTVRRDLDRIPRVGAKDVGADELTWFGRRQVPLTPNDVGPLAR